MSKYYPSASIEEIERRLKSNPEGIDGFWTGWLMPVKILSIRTGPRIKKNILIKPEKRFKQSSRDGLKPRKIFVCSMSDLFHDNVELSWLLEIFDVMLANPRHTYLLLTKRPANMEEALTHSGLTPQPNIWLGCTVENRHEAENRINPMHKLSRTTSKQAGWTTWVSYEPALELVDFTGWEFLDWLVIGGESGSNARSFHSDWARSVIAWCRQNEVAPFMKQMGSNSDLKVKGKGGEMSEWPEELRVREWPND